MKIVVFIKIAINACLNATANPLVVTARYILGHIYAHLYGDYKYAKSIELFNSFYMSLTVIYILEFKFPDSKSIYLMHARHSPI